jgi:hypothetical protein
MIAPAPERFFSYVLVQCADEVREELLNVGVLVFDPQTNELLPRFEKNLERIERVLRNVRIKHLRAVMNSTSASLPRVIDRDAIELLESAHSDWQNLLRASSLRSIAGTSADRVADDLFDRYVRVHSTRQQLKASSPTMWQFSSRRVVNSVRTRLERSGLKPDEDFSENAELIGYTRGRVPVPVWYPLQVTRTTLVDGLAMQEDPAHDYDLARLAAQKVEQTLRSNPQSRIAVVVRDPGSSSLGEKVQSIIADDGRIGEAVPIVFRYSQPDDLDDLVRELFEQRSLFGNGRQPDEPSRLS